MIRIYITLLAVAFIIIASCNSKPTAKKENINVPVDTIIENEVEATDSIKIEIYEDSLAYWTDNNIVREHGELVYVAQYVWRMNRNDKVTQKLDLIMKEVKRINPILIAYFDKHHKTKNFNKEQKIDSVLNEIESIYKPMSEGSTMSMIVGIDIYNALYSYREALLYNRMLQMAKTEKLRAALRDEMVKWKAFESELTSYLSSIATLCYWDGSLAGPARLMAYYNVIESRIDDQKNIYAVLFDKKEWKKGSNVKLAEKHFLKSIKLAVDSVFYEDHSEYFDKENDSIYIEDYKETINQQNDVKNTFAQWLKARKKLGISANLRENNWQMLTTVFLNKLSEKTLECATP